VALPGRYSDDDDCEPEEAGHDSDLLTESDDTERSAGRRPYTCVPRDMWVTPTHACKRCQWGRQ
jgi:hypothetical protein